MTGTPTVRPTKAVAAIEEMLLGDAHQGLIAEGVAHFAGPILVDVTGDLAIAVNYSLVMRRERGRFYLWRVSAVRWDIEKRESEWRVRRRTNRLLDESGGGRNLFGTTLREVFGEVPR